MGYIDFEKERVDKKILDSIVIEKKHFDFAIGIVHPSSLRENQVSLCLDINFINICSKSMQSINAGGSTRCSLGRCRWSRRCKA